MGIRRRKAVYDKQVKRSGECENNRGTKRFT